MAAPRYHPGKDYSPNTSALCHRYSICFAANQMLEHEMYPDRYAQSSASTSSSDYAPYQLRGTALPTATQLNL